MLDEHVEFLERAFVEQQFDALARGELAALVLGLDAGLAAAQPRLVPPLLQLVEDIFHEPLPCAIVFRNRAKGIPRRAIRCRPDRRKRGRKAIGVRPGIAPSPDAIFTKFDPLHDQNILQLPVLYFRADLAILA